MVFLAALLIGHWFPGYPLVEWVTQTVCGESKVIPALLSLFGIGLITFGFVALQATNKLYLWLGEPFSAMCLGAEYLIFGALTSM